MKITAVILNGQTPLPATDILETLTTVLVGKILRAPRMPELERPPERTDRSLYVIQSFISNPPASDQLQTNVTTSISVHPKHITDTQQEINNTWYAYTSYEIMIFKDIANMRRLS